MKNFLKKSVLFLVFIVVFTVTACGFGGARTSDEIYAAMAKATRDFDEYKGALTIKMNYTIEENGKQTGNAEIDYSIDPEQKIMYLTIDSGKTGIKVKVFDSKVMIALKTQQQTGANTNIVESINYYKLQEYAVWFFTSKQSFSAVSDQDLDAILKEYLYTFTETKAAHERVYAEQVEKRKVSDKSAYAEYDVKTGRGLNSLSLREYSKIRKTVNTGVYTLENSEKIVGKGGKITRVEVVRDLLYASDSDNGKNREKRTLKIDIKYVFDKKGYNKIETQPPEYLNYYQYSETFKMKFDIGGMITEKSYDAKIFDSQWIFNNLSKDFNNKGYKIEWYSDPDHTIPFVAQDMSYDEFKRVKCVFGKVTVPDGYAVIARDYRVRDERSDDYKAVFGPVNEIYNSNETLVIKEISSPYSMPVSSYENAVDGKLYDYNSRTLDLESGKFYLITHSKIEKDEDYSIFDIDVSSLWVYGEDPFEISF